MTAPHNHHATQQQEFGLSMFGTDLDLAGLAALRLGEHALHTRDIAVAIDPAAAVSADAVELLIDTLPQTAARVGKPVTDVDATTIATTAPDRQFLLTVGPDIVLTANADPAAALQLPAEAFIRLVYGRLDPDHTPADVADDSRIALLRNVFPGV